jgi:two-component system response regulator GlrR
MGKLERFSKAAAPLLISGESGTGKELYARAVHYMGPQRDSPFLPVNCGMLSENLLENELFGHERGAYTDAHKRKEGLIQEADSGTLFLDEIDSLSPLSQVKLLRFIEDGSYKLLGSSKLMRADVRIICASNVDLAEAVRKGEFREDLYYRITVLKVQLPSLRTRDGDIVVLATHFLNEFSTRYQTGNLSFSEEAIHILLAHTWPGNVRELKNVVERAVIMSSSRTISAADLEIGASTALDIEANPTFLAAKRCALASFEKEYLETLLRIHGWNVSKASLAAGVHRKSIQRLIRKYGLLTETFR